MIDIEYLLSMKGLGQDVFIRMRSCFSAQFRRAMQPFSFAIIFALFANWPSICQYGEISCLTHHLGVCQFELLSPAPPPGLEPYAICF